MKSFSVFLLFGSFSAFGQDILFGNEKGFGISQTRREEFRIRPKNCPKLCIPLDRCPSLLAYLYSPTPEKIGELKKASCGFFHSDPLVWCEGNCLEGNQNQSPTPHPTLPSTTTTTTTSTTESATQAIRDFNLLSNANFFRNRKLPMLNDEDCGTSFPTRISGGHAASKGEFPWIAAISVHTPSGPQAICGGALINEEFVLTAAHCVTDSSHQIRNISHVRLGAHNISKFNEEGAENIAIDKILFHPEFRERPIIKNDIALLKLKRKVNFNTLIGTVCLPENNDMYIPRARTTIAGWGSDGIRSNYALLQKVEIPLVPSDDCRRQFYRVRVRILPEYQFCAGIKGKDSCKGDSGGPLMYTKDGKAYLLGVISFGTVQCDGRLPGVYTKVSTYMNWIKTTIEKNTNVVTY